MVGCEVILNTRQVRPRIPVGLLFLSDPLIALLIFCKKDLFFWASSHSGILFSSLFLINGIYQIHWLSSSLVTLVQCSVFSFFPKSYHPERLQCLDGHLIRLETSQWLSPLLYQDSLAITKKHHHYQNKVLKRFTLWLQFPKFPVLSPSYSNTDFPSHWDLLSLDPTKLSLSIIPSFHYLFPQPAWFSRSFTSSTPLITSSTIPLPHCLYQLYSFANLQTLSQSKCLPSL